MEGLNAMEGSNPSLLEEDYAPSMKPWIRIQHPLPLKDDVPMDDEGLEPFPMISKNPPISNPMLLAAVNAIVEGSNPSLLEEETMEDLNAMEGSNPSLLEEDYAPSMKPWIRIQHPLPLKDDVPMDDEGLEPFPMISKNPPISNPMLLAAVNAIVEEFNAQLNDAQLNDAQLNDAQLNDGWFSDECNALYYRYFRHQGHFIAIKNCIELSNRSVEECMFKIFEDHNFCVAQISEPPWEQIDELLDIQIVEPTGHHGLMLNGGGWPALDIAAAAAALEGGGLADALAAAFVHFLADSHISGFVRAGLDHAVVIYSGYMGPFNAVAEGAAVAVADGAAVAVADGAAVAVAEGAAVAVAEVAANSVAEVAADSVAEGAGPAAEGAEGHDASSLACYVAVFSAAAVALGFLLFKKKN
ncbi:uncharacterized protein LOC123899809 isoform X2 [Trifolium pratense]|uniref:uncharacterized protein LOC123899809 isoform X2 n=1 Tax=Trifolium pratense TaxID=57577 RepID=UPI001E694322|nr:uncharacterized protein LOC123899809 isoform X2 [Trifolium pratense]